MDVGVKIEEGTEGLGSGDEGGDRSFEVWKTILEEVTDGAIGRAAEVAVEFAVELEDEPEDLGDREDQRRAAEIAVESDRSARFS